MNMIFCYWDDCLFINKQRKLKEELEKPEEKLEEKPEEPKDV
jgi:hypothetical protein